KLPLTIRLDREATGGMSSMETENVRSIRYLGMAETIMQPPTRLQTNSGSDRRRCSLLQLRDHQLPHAHHAAHHALRRLGVWFRWQLWQHPWHDLPGHAVAILEPSARALLATLGQRVPEVVDLLLVVAHHLERDGLAERVVRAAVQPEERPAVELEGDGQNH